MSKHLTVFAFAFALLANTATTHAATLVADYKFSDPANVGADSSGNGFTGTNNGAVRGGAGSSSYISVSGGSYFITPPLSSSTMGPLNTSDTSVSISTWFNATPAPAGAGGVIVTELGTQTPNAQWHDTQIELETNNTVSNGVWQYSSRTPQLNAQAINPGHWYQDTLVYDNTAQTVSEYIDGALVASKAQNRSAPWNGGGFPENYAFGAADGTNFGNGAAFNGLIGETEIFNGALSSADVASLFAAQAGQYVPEPSSVVALLGLCGMGLVCLLRNRRRRA